MAREPEGLSLPRLEETEKEQSFLMKAKNGMEVWVPESRLAAWEAAQAGPGGPLTLARRQLKGRLLERLSGVRK